MSRQQARLTDEAGATQLLLWVVRAGVLLVLLTPLIVSTGTYFPFVVGKAIYSRSIIEVTFVLWLLLMLYDPQYRLGRSWVIAAFGLWLVISILAGLTGVSPVRSMWSTYERMQGLFDLAHWFCFVIVAASVFRTFTSWKVLFSVNLAVGTVVAVLGLGQHFDLINFNWIGGSSRIESTIGNATYVGAYAAVNVLLGAGLIAQSFSHQAREPVRGRGRSRAARRRRQSASPAFSLDYYTALRAFWLLAAFANLLTLWLTSTRGAVVGLGAALFVFAIWYSGWGRVKAARWAGYAILVGAIAVLALLLTTRATSVLDPVVESSTMLKRLSTMSLDDSSIKGRTLSAEAGFRAFLERPLLGWGPENYTVAWGKHYESESPPRELFDQAHSKPVEELTTKGGVGLISYLLVWCAMALVVLRSFRAESGFQQLFVAVFGVTLVAYFVQNLFLFDTPTTVMIFCVLAAFTVAEEQRLNADNKDPQTEPSNWRRRVDLSGVVNALRTPLGGTALAVVLAAAALASLFLFNFRPYLAAEDIAQSKRNISWDAKLELLDQAIEDFPGLANYPRRELVDAAARSIKSLPDDEFRKVVDRVEIEARRGLEAEPDNWRLMIALARFYHVASDLDESYVEVAQEYVDDAHQRAPMILKVSTATDQ